MTASTGGKNRQKRPKFAPGGPVEVPDGGSHPAPKTAPQRPTTRAR
ncbi:hypothetical protein [Nitrosomonas communis]|nr:hypothetical protein [Nitrosomonas communis]MCO6426784.1 hypothetical protein [Nitrosomonas communis]